MRQAKTRKQKEEKIMQKAKKLSKPSYAPKVKRLRFVFRDMTDVRRGVKHILSEMTKYQQ